MGRAQKAKGFYPSKARNVAISSVAPSLMPLGWKGEVLYPMCHYCAVPPPLGRTCGGQQPGVKKHCGKHCDPQPQDVEALAARRAAEGALAPNVPALDSVQPHVLQFAALKALILLVQSPGARKRARGGGERG